MEVFLEWVKLFPEKKVIYLKKRKAVLDVLLTSVKLKKLQKELVIFDQCGSLVFPLDASVVYYSLNHFATFRQPFDL